MQGLSHFVPLLCPTAQQCSNICIIFTISDNVRLVASYINDKASDTLASTTIIKNLSDQVASLKYETKSTNFAASVYALDKITAEIQSITDKGKHFGSQFQQLESSKFGFEIATIVIISVILIVALVCKCKFNTQVISSEKTKLFWHLVSFFSPGLFQLTLCLVSICLTSCFLLTFAKMSTSMSHQEPCHLLKKV